MKVIYVMGEGRSGSTILDVLLSNHPDVIGVGELWSFFEEGERRDYVHASVCTCGERREQCPFWSKVDAEFLKRSPYSLAQAREIRRKYDRLRWFGLRCLGVTGPNHAAYSQITLALYDAICFAANKRIIIDSTKHVGRAISLTRVAGVDLSYVHLIRDGRAIWWSRLRDKIHSPGFQTPIRYTAWFNATAWTIKNSLALIVCKISKCPYVRVRYEDLVQHPKEELARLGNACQLDMQTVANKVISGAGFSPGHQIGGNLRARTGSVVLKLKYDAEWNQKLTAAQKRLYWLLTGWFAKSFGYSRTVESSQSEQKPLDQARP